MDKRAVVIGCDDAARATALTRAVAARSAVPVSVVPSLERAMAAGRGEDAAVVVLDGFPSGAVLRVMDDVTTVRPEVAVLVVGPLDPDTDVLIALASGASGYMPAGSDPEAIGDAVNTLLAGEAVLPRAVSFPLVQHLRLGGRGIVATSVDGRAAELTSREWEILVLLRQERTTAEIAQRLVVSNGTVRSHVAALLHKLGARDRGALAPIQR